ncbi:ABC-type Mn2+/Zn2+ transport system permease subunit [Micromonospora pisi]|uniref:ABC-type Mn2+/Zn2+ transport system permease subunit n=1 Tax=Micromonospora pisi TaxID=589240 RepID=A0A495JRX0_9ACTN|nr:metal ABC transporter permease [Micromonospora pisi]RKR91736.1 ABC-type Mn2+/Zn2+ transport system permease subunit [Micromonospora pisi]
MSWWDDVFHRALVAAMLVGLLAALVGVQVVLRRLSFFTMAMSHATFPGVVAASIIGINIYLGGALAGLLVAIAVAALSRVRGQDAAAATGVILSAGFALGVGLVATQNGFSRDLSSFLVGSILTVSTGDLVVIAAVLCLVGLASTLGARQLLFVGFDRVGARAAGLRPGLVDLVLLVGIELVIVAVVPVVGTILTLALVVAPAAAGRAWSDRIGVITGLAMFFGAVSGVAGLLVSSAYDVAAGASITLVATAILLLSLVGGGWLRPVLRRLRTGASTGPTAADPYR